MLNRHAFEMTNETFKYQVLPLKQMYFRFAYSLVKSAEVAEDIVQDVLLKIWQKADEIDNFKAYGMRLTRNLSLDKLKAANAQVVGIADGFNMATAMPNPLENTIGENISVLIEEALENLNEQQRICWQLREVEAFSYQEIAAHTQLTMEQVKVNIFRARKSLQKQLQLLKN